ncbi:MAG: oxaloacetate decarboxylase [Saprospiraceae bacterium]|nr:oxaloacetate decarboxylase [Bacteroidia bacterium]NNE13840.1 oxaloacetate decarboxylase [Saprospiraceae bacterium]NNL93342.1 oxaloacetate decarboxylase [Saprospiraceae bacterium]
MGKEIKLALVYRDMWQASGKYMPNIDELVSVADPIIAMGCFDRVETNGGGFEQINLLKGENPNKSVRAWTDPFNKVGIQTHMLERGLNGIRMSPVSKDVRKLMFALKKKQGTDISRSFDGLNNPQNLELSFQYAKEGGMIAQGALSITHSPVHTIEYYIKLADQYIERGAEEICIKDMAGVGRPVSIGKIVKGIRERHPNIVITYHGHSTTGFAIVSSLEAARNGANIIDVGMEPLSWGTGHCDLLSVHAMLKDAGFSLKDVNMDAYMEVRSQTQAIIDNSLGYYINKQNRFLNSLLIGPGLPGGMMGSLMADLEKNLKSVNKWLSKNNKPTLTQDELLIKLFNEVEHTWPKVGYPPLVTPFSQYVKNLSLMNVIQVIKGKQRFSMIDENTWGMMLGKSGQLPGQLDDEIIQLAKDQGREFYTGNPQDLYPDVLEDFSAKMKEKGWDEGKDKEELFEYAMHPQQYEDFKSGRARENYLKDLEGKKNAAKAPQVSQSSAALNNLQPKSLIVEVNGEKFKVNIDYPNESDGNAVDTNKSKAQPHADSDSGKYITSPLEGKFFLTKNSSEKAIVVGDEVKVGDTVAYVESMKVINAITSSVAGTVQEIYVNHGDDIEEDSPLIKLS